MWYDHKSNKTKLVYKDLNQRVVEYIAAWIEQSLGPVGIYIEKKENELVQKQEQDRRAFVEALGNIQ